VFDAQTPIEALRTPFNSATPSNDPGKYYEVMAIFRRRLAKQAVECVKL
jgi:hypothetical protein